MYYVNDIFTPSSPAIYTFVDRFSLNDLLVDSIHTKGKQIIIYGHTGTGKTTLLHNKLNQTYDGFVVTKCTSNMTFDQVVLNAFDELGQFVISSKTSTLEKKKGWNISGDYNFIKSSISFDFTTKASEEIKPIVPPQLSPQKLASFFGLSNSCWVIDDFHKLPNTEKKFLSQWMKVFMDESVNHPFIKIIAIGAVGKAKEVIELDNELNNRVAEIHVPFMSVEELKQIIILGESKLNISITEDVKSKIINFSSGLPSVTHQLCLNLCFSKGLYQTAESTTSFDLNDFKNALASYILQNSGYLQTRYEKAISEDQEDKIPIYYHIIRSFLLCKKHNLAITDIIKYFKDHQHPQSEPLLRYLLEQLATDKRGKALDYEEESDTWFIPDPFFKVYCICIIDLKKTVLQAQLDLFSSESIEKSKNKIKEQQKDLVKKALNSGDYFDF